MFWILTVLGVVALVTSLAIVFRIKRLSEQRQMEQHSITPEKLHALLASNREVLLFDVRQPLDLLDHPEIIPKAQRIAPNEILEKPSLIPKEKDAVVYLPVRATKPVEQFCVGHWHFSSSGSCCSRVDWRPGRQAGIRFEPYQEVFHLYTPTLAPRSG